MKYLLALPLLFAFLFSNAQHIDNRIEGQFNDHHTVTYLIKVKSQYDLSQAFQLKGKAAKAQFVYQTLKQHNAQSQNNIKTILDDNLINYTPYLVSNTIKVESDFEVFKKIKYLPEVEAIIWDAPIPMQTFWEERDNNQLRNPEPEWGIQMIKADQVWEMGYTGEGVVVSGQDTGYDWLVEPLQRKYRGFVSDSMGVHDYNWFDAISGPSPLHGDTINPCGFSVKEPCDDHNHGTHTMGTIVGSDTSNAIGVAPGASWIACRNMDRGYGSPSTYLACFEWFLAPRDTNGENPDPSMSPHVINNSWACPEMEGCNPDNWIFLEEAVNNLRAAGTVVVVSAGNDGSQCGSIANPAAIFEGSFSVGATTNMDTIAGFSSRGMVSVDSSFRQKPNVAAPGRGIRSVIRGGDFRNFSGTSMAGPHVAGLVALIIDANPDLEGEVEAIETIIEMSAIPLETQQECDGTTGEDIPNATYGYGRVDAVRAVELALNYGFEFAPFGAKWTFQTGGFIPDVCPLNNIIEVIGDTIIQGKSCRIVQKAVSTCDLLPHINYVYNQGLKVYLFDIDKEAFHLIYDFGASEGESYQVLLPDFVLEDSYHEVKVLETATINIDGTDYPAQFVEVSFHHDQGEDIVGLDTIVQPFGSLSSLFMQEAFLCDDCRDFDLRCYSDNNISVQFVSSEEECLLSSVDYTFLDNISISPNPVQDILTIRGLKKQTNYSLYSSQGVFIQKGTLRANQELSVEFLPDGLYIISFDNMARNFKFVKY